MYIERTRYIVRRRHDDAIMCGSARNFHFKKRTEIGNAPIKTYASEKKALAAAKVAFNYDESQVYAEKVSEILTSF